MSDRIDSWPKSNRAPGTARGSEKGTSMSSIDELENNLQKASDAFAAAADAAWLSAAERDSDDVRGHLASLASAAATALGLIMALKAE